MGNGVLHFCILYFYDDTTFHLACIGAIGKIESDWNRIGTTGVSTIIKRTAFFPHISSWTRLICLLFFSTLSLEITTHNGLCFYGRGIGNGVSGDTQTRTYKQFVGQMAIGAFGHFTTLWNLYCYRAIAVLDCTRSHHHDSVVFSVEWGIQGLLGSDGGSHNLIATGTSQLNSELVSEQNNSEPFFFGKKPSVHSFQSCQILSFLPCHGDDQ